MNDWIDKIIKVPTGAVDYGCFHVESFVSVEDCRDIYLVVKTKIHAEHGCRITLVGNVTICAYIPKEEVLEMVNEHKNEDKF